MKSIFISFAFLCTALLPSLQATDLTATDYSKDPSLSLFTISPSGKYLSYRQVNEKSDLIVVIDAATNKMVSAVNVSGVKPALSYFINDERLIMVMSENRIIQGYKGRHDVSAAFSYNIKSKKLHQTLIAGKGIHLGQSRLGGVIGVSSNKKYAYMKAWSTESENHLFKVDLTKGNRPKTYKRGSKYTTDFFVNSEGKVLARESFNDSSNVHKLEALQDGDWITIYQKKTDIPEVSFNGVTPDGLSLLIKKHNDDNDRWAYHTISLKDGSVSEAIFSRENKDVERLLKDINRVVYGVQYSGFKPSYEFFDDKITNTIKNLTAAFPNNAVMISDHTPDWSTIILNLQGNDSSGEYYRYHNGKLHLFARARPSITKDKVHIAHAINYKARDGLNIPTLLTLPNNKGMSNLPAIMLPHGGPESYDRLRFDWLSQYFANQGYVVIQPQFRGSKGFGSQHKHEGRGEWGRKMQDDLTDGVKEFAREGIIDPKRVCIVGASYGGYAALAGAAFTPDVYQCAISINGVSDIELMMKNDRKKYGRRHWVVSYWDKVIKSKKLDDNHLAQISPINSIDKITMPVLLIHGERDSIVDIEQSEEIFDAMKDAGKSVEFIELEKGNHNISDANNRKITLEAMGKFVKKHI